MGDQIEPQDEAQEPEAINPEDVTVTVNGEPVEGQVGAFEEPAGDEPDTGDVEGNDSGQAEEQP